MFSEYGAPEEGELKKPLPFALKNQLLSESSSVYSLIGQEHTVHLIFADLVCPPSQKSSLCFLMMQRRCRLRRNFQVNTGLTML